MIRRLLLVLVLSFALPVAARAVPATDYTDMWWNPAESGWGLSFVQHTVGVGEERGPQGLRTPGG